MRRATGFAASLAVSLALIGLFAPAPAHAFSEPRFYAIDPTAGGGGNRWFTGSPAEGYSCSQCHSGGPTPHLYIEGLPADGYVPGAVYDVRVSWPEFAARSAQLKNDLALVPAGVPKANPPSVGALAELVAESGLGAGTIEIATRNDAMDGERCPGGRFATELYVVRPGEKTVKALRSCEAAALGARCVVAVRSCGPAEVRFRWTAPPVAQGAIWFSTGFVATEQYSGDPYGDGVVERTRVMRPAGTSRTYESVLRSGGCAAASQTGAANSRSDAPWLIAGAFVLGCAARARRARRRAKACAARPAGAA